MPAPYLISSDVGGRADGQNVLRSVLAHHPAPGAPVDYCEAACVRTGGGPRLQGEARSAVRVWRVVAPETDTRGEAKQDDHQSLSIRVLIDPLGAVRWFPCLRGSLTRRPLGHYL